ncbi:DUF2817 domain-containing protein [Cupriavidus basilensis]
MGQVSGCFATSFAEARQKFLAARAAGATLAEFHPTRRGSGGEDLPADVAWVGPADASRVLMVSSGVHGVEGFCGSGAQVALLADAVLLADCAGAPWLAAGARGQSLRLFPICAGSTRTTST